VLGRSGACGARRPAQTAPNRGKAPAQGRWTPGGRAGEPARCPTHRSRPCRAASGCSGWHTLPGWRSCRPPLAPMTRAASALPHHGVPSGLAHDAVRQPRPRSVVLRRKGRTFADAGGACRAMIGCALAGSAGVVTGRVRTGSRSLSGVSGGASTDHPPGTPGHNPQVVDPYRRPPADVFSRFSRQMTMRRQSIRRTTRNEPGVKG
jgi:hypothetical protein